MKFTLDFLGIGSEKAATYWVADCLKSHPEVCFPNRKELAVFKEFDQHFLKILNPRYFWGTEWYGKQFAHCKRKTKGEYTPTYLYSEQTAIRIKKQYPHTKLIITLRDPVERAFSQYLHDTSTGVIRNCTFEEALRKYDGYVEKGLYFKHISNYLKHFPRKQMLFIFTEDIKTNPLQTVRRIYAFLNLKKTSFVPECIDSRPNPASEARLPWLNYFLLQTEFFLIKSNLDFILKFLIDSGIRRRIFIFSYYSNRKTLPIYPKMKASTKNKLKKIFRSDTEQLEKLLKKDLAAWK
jgi:hypothetical protein